MRTRIVIIAVLVAGAAACGDSRSDTTVDAVLPDASGVAFSGTVDNPYFPLVPGSRWVYEGVDEDEVERIEVVVTADDKRVLGFDTVVVRDTVSVDGEVIEDTFDWYLQDPDGNVWYVGEDSTEYEDGAVVGTAGSWEAGVDGAEPGIIMYADPAAAIGTAYYQEYYVGEAEDQARVLRVEASVTVAAGTFEDVIVIEEWNPFEKGVVEEKYYAAGVGVILEQKVKGGSERVELIEFTPGS